MPRALASSMLCLFLITGCSSSTASTSPDPGGSSAASSAAGQSSSPPPSPDASGGAPTQSPGPGSGALPTRDTARELGLAIQMAPAPDGSLFVSIPAPGGVVLTRLDRSGSPLPGWPITLRDTSTCEHLLAVHDGSLRVVCTLENPDGNMYNPIAALALSGAGEPLGGWPVALPGSRYQARMNADVLTLAETTPGSDVITVGEPSHAVALVTVDRNGTVRTGVPVPMLEAWPEDRWAIGPDGVAYGVHGSSASVSASQVTAIDSGGVRGGWPISIEGIASAPAFARDGRLILTVALPGPGFGSSRVVMVDGEGNVTDQSAELLIETGVLPPTADGAYECGVPVPRPPLNAGDGRIYVYGEIDDATYALDVLLDVLSGWPIVAGHLERPNPWLDHDGISCPALAIPAAGPNGTLVLPLQAMGSVGGGRLVAIGSNGEARPGWPVSLSRSGSEFWSAVVGGDGTTYALAIEPEAGGASSATVLAIAPDSTVIYATTIVDP